MGKYIRLVELMMWGYPFADEALLGDEPARVDKTKSANWEIKLTLKSEEELVEVMKSAFSRLGRDYASERIWAKCMNEIQRRAFAEFLKKYKLPNNHGWTYEQYIEQVKRYKEEEQANDV